jgi:hypothetical protein
MPTRRRMIGSSEIIPPESNNNQLLSQLARALELISKGDPLVSLRTELRTQFDAVSTRFQSIDKATELQHDDLVRVPTQVDRAVGALRELLLAQIRAEMAEVGGKLNALGEVSEERFRGVQTQFNLLKQATEQLDLANKTAIAAALQAQKESAGETQKSSQAAIAKSEASTSESIKALTAAFTTEIKGANDRINDVKSRLDRGEGIGSGGHQQKIEGNTNLFAVVALIIAAGTLAYAIFHPTQFVIEQPPGIAQPK